MLQADDPLGLMSNLYKRACTYAAFQEGLCLYPPILISTSRHDISSGSDKYPFDHSPTQLQARQGRRPRAVNCKFAQERTDAEGQRRRMGEQRHKRCHWSWEKRLRGRSSSAGHWKVSFARCHGAGRIILIVNRGSMHGGISNPGVDQWWRSAQRAPVSTDSGFPAESHRQCVKRSNVSLRSKKGTTHEVSRRTMGQRVSCPPTSSSISIMPVSSTACEGELVGGGKAWRRPCRFPRVEVCSVLSGFPYIFSFFRLQKTRCCQKGVEHLRFVIFVSAPGLSEMPCRVVKNGGETFNGVTAEQDGIVRIIDYPESPVGNKYPSSS